MTAFTAGHTFVVIANETRIFSCQTNKGAVGAMKMMPFVVMCALLSSCAYTRNRVNDAKDIFNCAVEAGIGSQAQVGPIRTGVGFSVGAIGMSDGHIGVAGIGHFAAACQGVLVGPGFKASSHEDEVIYRGKAFQQAQAFFFNPPEYETEVRGPYGGWMTTERGWLKPYYTQFEIQADCLGGMRMGINPGELIDFIFGFFGVDIYGDDIIGDKSNGEKELEPRPPTKVDQADVK